MTWECLDSGVGKTTIWNNGIMCDSVKIDIGESMIPNGMNTITLSFWNHPVPRTSVTWIKPDGRRTMGWGARSKTLIEG